MCSERLSTHPLIQKGAEVQNAPTAPMIRTNINFQIEILPADGIKLSLFWKRRPRNVTVFWAALSRANQLDRASTYHSGCITPSEFMSSDPAAPAQCRVVIGGGGSSIIFCSMGP
jgi:hypothetical protein